MQVGAFSGDHLVGLLGNGVNDVQTEAAGALICPPVHHIEQSLPDFGIVPVQVRLLDGILMQIVLLAILAPLPGRAAEHRAHLIGRAVGGAVTPNVPIVLGIISAGLGFDEPGMFIGSVVQNHIHQDLQPPGVGLPEQNLHIFQVTEERIDVLIIGNIVTIVILGRLKHRRQPDGIHAQALDVIQLLGNAPDIAQAVTVGVTETAGIDLINNGLLPPFCILCHKRITLFLKRFILNIISRIPSGVNPIIVFRHYGFPCIYVLS